ncbi:MAG: hypothetical protein ACP5RD_02115 [bacterium]
MKKINKIITIITLVLLIVFSIINLTYAQVIKGKFVRFGVDSVVINTENEVLNLPISKDLKVIDMNGNLINAASLYEGANVTINYDNGYVMSISVDNFNIVNQNINNNKPEYQILLKNYQNTPNYKNNDYNIPVKVSYVGYLPVDYQYIYAYKVDPNNISYPYYNYAPVTNYAYASYDLKIYKDYLAYDNMMLTNNPSSHLYYELKSSELNNNVPNYYYLAQFQPKYLENPNKNNIQNNDYYIATNNNKNLNSNDSNASIVYGKLVYMDNNTINLFTYDNNNLALKIDETTNIFVKKGVNYILLNNKNALNEVINKNIQVAVKNYNGQLIADTIIIQNQ